MEVVGWLRWYLAIGVFIAGRHQAKNCFSVLVRLLFRRCSGILAIICQFWGSAQIANRVAVNDRSPASGYHRPDPSSPVQNGQLQWRSTFRIQIGDVGLFRVGVTAEWWRVFDLAPFGAAEEVGRGVNFGSQIQQEDGVWRYHQWVNLHVGEVQIDVQVVQLSNKIANSPVTNINKIK